MDKIFLTFSPQMRANYYGDRALAGLRALGDVRMNPLDRALTSDELVEAANGCRFIVSDRQTPGDASIFERLPELIVYSRCAVDIRNVDVAAASECGVLVTRASAGFVASVAEWTIAVMIDLGRRITESTLTWRGGEFPVPVMGRQLRGSTVGIVGYGNIGRYVCELSLALGMRVVVNTPGPDFPSPPIELLPMDALLAASDYVVCFAPANAETENMFNAERFSKMKPGAFFINASRGELVDERALAQALDSGSIAGCALDVGRAPDQMPSPFLARHPKVIATPHTGGLTPQAVEHQALETVTQVAAILERSIPQGAVNAEHASRLSRLEVR